MFEKQLREIYLDYVNNYLTVEKFAEHNGLTVSQANQVIDMGRTLHEQHVALVKGTK